ncbi:MAG: DUF1904 family protein [Solobacterium sp.]|nr:DUF1904 family protein [Solobacterium sp.]
MPQIILKNISRKDYLDLSPAIAETVAGIISVPKEYIVTEFSDTYFCRGGEPDSHSAMAWVCWKKRTPELQQRTAAALAKILQGAGYHPVEIIYDNLDMNDFYEF